MADLTIDQAMQLARALHQAGRIVESEKLYRQVLVGQPRNASALNMLGVIGGQVGQYDHAADLINRAITISPTTPEFHNNLGEVYRQAGKIEKAVMAFGAAIKLRPDYPEAHHNLGLTLSRNGMIDQGIAEFREAIRYRPEYVKAHNNLGNALKEIADIEQTLASYRRAIAINPNDQSAWSNLLLAMHYHPDYDSQTILAEHKQWAALHADALTAQIQPYPNNRLASRRLKIGYVSPDFCDHSVGRMLVSLLSRHDHKAFEIFCYADVAKPDDMTQRLRSHADHWQSIVGMNDEQAAAKIRHDGIDILVDLAVHTAGNRLLVFARKPAPVQVSTMGCPTTTGLSAMDFRLTDPHLDPPGKTDADYTEKLIHLPHTTLCFEPHPISPAVNNLPALKNGFITFGSFNNFSKVNSTTLALWARVLNAIPNSRLILKTIPGKHHEQVRKIFTDAGVWAERIELVGKCSLADYFGLYHLVDIGLDPIPYNGHTTTFDYLWMGVPVITMTGRTCVGRAGTSVLMGLGLGELIGKSPEEYIAAAQKLAADIPKLSALRNELRQQMLASPLMDSAKYARDIEDAYRNMWRRWLD